MQALTLVQVGTIEAEGEVLAELGRLVERVGTPVAPVLDRAGLPQRLIQVLSAAGCQVRLLRQDELGPGAGDAPHAPLSGSPSRPAAVLASAGVEPDVLRLAAGLCGVRPALLSDLPAAFAAGAPPATALVLVNPERAEVGDVAPALAALAGMGVHVGVLYTLDPVESRLAILKSLMVGRLEGRGAFSILSAHHIQAADAAPACLQNPSGEEILRTFGREQDLLLVSGHSNALDGALGADAALCARAGTVDRPSSEGRFPCFADGLCFRQPPMGRRPEERTGLVALREARASVVVLSGCSAATLGRAWFSARHGLAYQCQQQAGLAAAVTGSLTLAELELDFLFVALLAEGLPLGEVVAGVNRARSQEHGHATAYPAGVGPFILLGNPCLRVAGFELQRAAVRAEPGRPLALDLSPIRFDPEHGAIVRVRLTRDTRPPYILLHSGPDEVWCRGVWYPSNDSAVLYLWLSTTRGNGRCDGQLELGCYRQDPAQALCAAVEHVLGQAPFWMVALGSYRSRWGDAGLSPEGLDAALAALPAMVRELSLAVAALRPRPGILVDERHMGAHAAAVWDRMAEAARRLLGCLVDIACRFGTLQSSGWEGNFHKLEPLGPLAPCTCGNPLWGQLYRYPGGGTLVRAEYQCPACGPVGEDDGRRLLWLTGVPRAVAQGAVLRASVECRAPEGEFVQVAAVAVVESLMRDRRMAGDPVTETVGPGQVRQLSLDVRVPEDLSPGVYPFAVLAIVNGAGYVLRRMVEVTRPGKEERS